MRVLSFLIVLISAVSATTSVNAGVINTKIELDADHLPRVLAADHQHTQRSLRRHDFAEVAEIAEERAGLEKVDDFITKMDDTVGATGKMGDVVGMAGKLVPTWKSALNKVAEHSVLVKKLIEKYPIAEDLSLPALKELARVEGLKLKRVAVGTFNKNTGGGMRMHIEHFEGIKIAPKKYLESHVGRNLQRYGDDGSRLLSVGVVGDGDNVVLISSSGKPFDWIIMKGGWDKGEEIEHAALREVIEEAGIRARLNHFLGKFTFTDGKKKHTMFGYMMDDLEHLDDWAESSRYRIVIPIADAKKLGANRPWMVKYLEQVEEMNALIKRGKLPKRDPKLEKFELDMN